MQNADTICALSSLSRCRPASQSLPVRKLRSCAAAVGHRRPIQTRLPSRGCRPRTWPALARSISRVAPCAPDPGPHAHVARDGPAQPVHRTVHLGRVSPEDRARAAPLCSYVIITDLSSSSPRGARAPGRTPESQPSANVSRGATSCASDWHPLAPWPAGRRRSGAGSNENSSWQLSTPAERGVPVRIDPVCCAAVKQGERRT
ncbi:hypothetical protein BD309DRAFT_721793 [Dichomitus squalens]|nr:hypothetical protein BD309DRAFT_721793 [Dichomitus squalens]